MSILARLSILLIRFYQRVVSPLFPPSCRFSPTCSQYALTAVERHGFFKGTFLAVWRLFRCNPLFPGGYDPVPEQFRWFRRQPPPDCPE
ncbi:MAG: membrane protein insertion efficiency factor YidD [Gemmatimonadetes bacterium]|nr:MAG: membrane protein insertion efficiency factor YidD [Gemmatimonadota bacterium]